MPKRKEPPLPPKTQFKRFMEAARELEVDEKAAERVFKQLAPKKCAPQSKRKS
jgi:hypothetical protein